MKILVLGHSDSEGTRLPNPSDAWPYLVKADIERHTGLPVEVIHRNLFAGPTAASFVQKQVSNHQPDVVVVGTSTYGVVVQLVSNRVNELVGPRAAALTSRAERAAARWTRRLGPRGSWPLVQFRRLTRRAIGTRPALSLQAMIDSYEDCLSELARAENVHTIVLAGVGYTIEHRRLNPALDVQQERATTAFHLMALRHHFDWLHHEAILGGPEAKTPYFQPDGVHTGEASNRLVADAITPLILDSQHRP